MHLHDPWPAVDQQPPHTAAAPLDLRPTASTRGHRRPAPAHPSLNITVSGPATAADAVPGPQPPIMSDRRRGERATGGGLSAIRTLAGT